jgi:CDP-diacylglycerol--serine O-phosphatidyltransferase
MFKYIEQAVSNENGLIYLPYVGLLIVIFSALRLAIFNVDETQKDSFRGVPTPANTLFITGLPFLSSFLPLIGNYWVLTAITIVFSLLLVSRFELFALKFKNFKWADNQLRFTFLLLAVLLLAIFQFAALPVIIILYIILSLGAKVFTK